MDAGKVDLFQENSFLAKKAVKAVMLINVVLALVAVFKDIFLASYLGTSLQADAFWLAYFVPDMVNVLGGSLTAACIPVFSRLLVADEPKRLKDSFVGVTIFFTLSSLLLLTVFYLARDQILRGLGPSLNNAAISLSAELFILMIPSVLMFPLINTGTAFLQVHDRFSLPAAVPVVFNVAILGSVLYGYLADLPLDKGVYFLALGFLGGASAMMVMVWFGVSRESKVSVRINWRSINNTRKEISEIMKLFVPYLLILTASQIVYAVERFLASGLEVGSIAGLNYAFRISQFPIWVFVSAVSTVAFPSMSKAMGLGVMKEIGETFRRSLRLVLIIILPLAIYLFLLRYQIISVLFQRGAFNGNSVRITAGIMAGYALGIVAQGIAALCLRAFLALGRPYTAVFSFAASTGLNICLDFLLTGPMGSAGLGYGAAAGAVVNAIILLYFLDMALDSGITVQACSLMKIVLANVFILPVAVIFIILWDYWGLNTSGLGVKALYAAGVTAGGLAAYTAGLRILKIRVLPR